MKVRIYQHDGDEIDMSDVEQLERRHNHEAAKKGHTSDGAVSQSTVLVIWESVRVPESEP
jgi:hypothetical protein